MTAETPVEKKKRSLVIPIVIVVVILVIAAIGLVLYKNRSSGSSAPPARKAAFGLFLAWKNANQAAAAKNANPASVQSLFVLNPSEAQEFAFRACKKVRGSDQKQCVWRRSDGQLVMTVATINDKPKVTAVKVTGSSSSSSTSSTSSPSGASSSSSTSSTSVP